MHLKSLNLVIDADAVFIPETIKRIDCQHNAWLNVLVCLGYDPHYLPYADLLRQHLGLDGEWAIASPVHWQATHNNASIVAYGQDLGLSEQQSQHWCALFSRYLAEDGLRLDYYDAQTWLLSITNKPLLTAKSVHQVVNYPLISELTSLDTSLYWQKFFTESQMFFSSQPGDLLLNGVWLWGNAALKKNETMRLCVTEQFFSLAQRCCTQVSVYTPSLSLQEYDMLLIDTIDSLSQVHQEQLQKMSVNWYWNNVAYSSSELNWFTRFWKALTHAY